MLVKKHLLIDAYELREGGLFITYFYTEIIRTYYNLKQMSVEHNLRIK